MGIRGRQILRVISSAHSHWLVFTPALGVSPYWLCINHLVWEGERFRKYPRLVPLHTNLVRISGRFQYILEAFQVILTPTGSEKAQVRVDYEMPCNYTVKNCRIGFWGVEVGPFCFCPGGHQDASCPQRGCDLGRTVFSSKGRRCPGELTAEGRAPAITAAGPRACHF